MIKMQWQGVFAPVPTPFGSSGDIAVKKLAGNIQFLRKHGLTGVVVFGSNGEAVHLTAEEKKEVLAAVMDAAPDGWLVAAGTGCQSTRETIELTRSSAALGAHAALILPPFFYKGQMNAEALEAHFYSVAEASPIPVFVYNMPANTGLDIPADILIRLAGHPNIIGVKDSGGNMAAMAQVRHHAPDFLVFAGSAGFLLPALSLGARGGIMALANIAPSLCVELVQAFRDGNLEKAESLQARIVDLNSAVTRRWGVPALKAAMDHLQLYGGPVRMPLLPLAETHLEELIALLEHTLSSDD